MKKVNLVPEIDDAMTDEKLFRIIDEMKADGEELLCTDAIVDNKASQPIAS